MKNKEIEIDLSELSFILNNFKQEIIKISSQDEIPDFEKDLKIKIKKDDCLSVINELVNIKIKNLLLKKGKIQIVYEKAN